MRLAALALLVSAGAAHAAATQWIAQCTTRQESTVWFVLSTPLGKDGAQPNLDFHCTGLFFDTVEPTYTSEVAGVE